MKISKRHLRRIIQEALEEADNPCWDGYRPGAQSGRKTKIGKSGKRVANCEKISETDAPLKEQEISGPDLTRGKDFSVGGSGEGKAAATASYDEMYYDLVDDYYAWVDENGHITPSASSVMASYFLEKGLEDDHKKHKMLSKAFAVSHDDIMADVRRQKAERAMLVGESKTKITKMQLKALIREAMDDEPIRQITGDSFSPEMLKTRKRVRSTPNAFKDTIIMSPSGDVLLVGGKETQLQNAVRELEVQSGESISPRIAGDINAKLLRQMGEGYVEMPISWSPNTGWKY